MKNLLKGKRNMKLHFYQPKFDKQIDTYILTDEQLQFTGIPKESIEFSKAEDNHYPILVLENDQLVTFLLFIHARVCSLTQRMRMPY